MQHEIVEKLLRAYAEELQHRYMTICSVPACMACQSRRIEAKEKFRDFRHTLAEFIIIQGGMEGSLLHAFVMNYPLEVK